MEAPENIGSALKSIISRYGEMTSDPTKLVDSEGEEMNLNKVDKALKSVGITLQDANGQFRNFDEVILELSSKWDTIDTNTQRYIATIMAGNRQQSRFLAMVGNYERLAELSEEAADSEDAALIQQLKTMDSIEIKLNQMKVAFQEFYTSTGIEDLIKGILDFVTRIINTMNSMPKLFGKIPVAALGVVAQLVASIKTLSNKFLTVIDQLAERISKAIYKGFKDGAEKGGAAAQQELNNIPSNSSGGEANKDSLAKQVPKWANIASTAASLLGTAASFLGIMMADGSNKIAGSMEIAGSILNGVGTGLSTGFAIGGPWGAAIGAIVGIISALPGVISGAAEAIETTEERVDKLGKKIKETEEETLLSKNELKTLENYRKKYEELYDARNDSNEAYQEWLDLNNEIAATYPSLISSMDAEGNYVVSLGEAYEKLVKEKKANYLADLRQQGARRIEGAYDVQYSTSGQMPKKETGFEGYIYGAYENLNYESVNSWFRTKGTSGISPFSIFQTYTPSVLVGYDKEAKNAFRYGGLGAPIYDYSSGLLSALGIDDRLFDTADDAIDFNKTFIDKASSFYFSESPEMNGDVKASFAQAALDLGLVQSKEELNLDFLNDYLGLFSMLSNTVSDASIIAQNQVKEYTAAKLELDSNLQAAIAQTEMSTLFMDTINWEEVAEEVAKGEKTESEIISELYEDFIADFDKNFSQITLPNVSEEVENFYVSLGNYSQRTIEEMKGALEIEKYSQIANEFELKWQSEIQPRIDRFTDGMVEFFKGFFEWEENKKSPALEAIINNAPVEFLDEILAQYKKIDIETEYGQKIFSGYNQIWETIEKNTDAEEAQQISSLVAKADLTTLTGILTLVESVEELDSTTSTTIEALTGIINVNLQTEWRLFSEKLTTSLESLGEVLNKASSGMNLKEAQEMASKLGVSITDFELVDGQFFYHNLEVLENAYLEQYVTLRQQLQSETQSQIDSLGELRDVNKMSSIKESWSEENQILFNTYFEDWKEAITSKEFTGTFYQYVVEQLRQMEQENLVVTDEYLRQQVAQITRERLEQIYDTISNGISGSMSEGEFSQLDYYLKENGHNFTLQTYETAEGLKLTEDSVLRVYEALKQTDSLAAQVVLDELTESAMEAEEKFNNIYEVLEHIAKINEEIAKAGISDARRKELERELILAENIRDTLMEAGNAFNFMNQDLPTGHTNPLSAWEGMNEAWSVLEGDDFKEGYIDYTDFYNMVNMMGDEGLEVAGLFNGKITTASQLMQAAGQALVRVDGKVFIDWTKLGEDFLGSAEGMKAGLDKGIKIIAEQQIKLLDAQIAMLEAAIALEEVNFDNDGIFKFDEIVNKEDGLFSSDSLKYLDFIKNYFGDYFIDGVPLMDALLTKLPPKELESFFTQLNHIFTNWDPNNIEASLESFNALMNQYFSGSITSGEATFGSIITPKYNFETEQMEYFINGVKVENEDYETLLSHLYKEDLDLTNYANKYGLIIPPAYGGTLSTLLSFNSQVAVSFKDGETIYINKETGREFVNSANPDIALSWAYADYMESQYAKNTFSDAQLKPVPINGTQEILYSLTVNGKTEFYWRGRKFENQEEADEAIRKSLNIEKGFASSSGSSSSSSSSESPGYSYAATEELTLESGITVKVNRVIDEENSGETIGFIYEGNYYENETQLSEALAEKTPDLPETEVETSAKVVLKTDNITIGTENESGKAEIEIGEVIAHSSGVEISAKDGNVTFTVNGKEVEGPQFMAELGVVNLDNLNALIDAVEKLEVPSELAADLETIASKLKTLGESLSDAQVKRIGDLASNLSKIQTSTKTLTVELSVSSTGSVDVTKVGDATEAKGTVDNLSFATGNAKATGTLMGELGPELYVTGGRYYVAGQNGAEFVNLPSDAIVFNHLQTRRLLENGSINGTGKPVTNERNAVAMATGTTGPAMASAQETLDRLKEIRSLWQGLLDASSQNLGKKAGGSSGSGGEDDKAFMHELERWYNLLRQIAKLEQQITYEQAKRENMQSGYKHVQSLEKELALLKKQQAAHQELSKLQREYYDERRDVLKNTSYGKLIFTYDEDGLMQYIEEDGKGLDILAELEKTDENGKAVRNAQEQVAYLDRVGFDISTLLTNADGSKVKSNDYQTMMQIFWDGVDGWMAELDELYDSYNESMTSVEEAIQAQNEIMQEYIDNQLSVEERLMEAIVSREEAEIERLEKELDALDEATNKYLDGLKDSLDREKQMYERNKDSEETAKLQRQLAILKRTGGSASEIQSLQDEISSRLEDSYFQQQEDQIDALEQAANNQIEKLQTQIDIMNETLEYQKANGLLWEEVYKMMNNWSPEQMLQFIEEFLPSYRENSALQNDQDSQKALKEFEIWVAKRENAEALADAWQSYYDSVDQYSDEFKAEHAEGAKNAYNLAYATEGEDAAKKAADDYFAKQASLLSGPGSSGDEEKEEQLETGTSPVEDGEKTSKKASQTSGEIKRGDKGEDVRAVQKALSSLGYYKGSIDGVFGEATQSAVYSFQKAMGIQADGIVGNKTREKFKLKGYKTGGLVDFTGPAWVDGTKTKPEAFLSAEDTAMLKSRIFDNNKYSLRSVVELFEGIGNSSKNITTNNDQGVVFENVQITIESGTIANDYDARRAGEMALEEMLKISRKTANRIVSRR